MCHKPTTTVLATINTVDFLYTCPIHLSDHEFATLISDGPKLPSSTVSAEEIARIKAEWEEKQKKKAEKEKEAKKEKEKEGDKDKSKEADRDTSKKKEGPNSPLSGSVSPSPAPATPTASHERYALHRGIFAS